MSTTVVISGKVKQTCSQCGKVRETTSDRVPKGWKRTDRLYCDTCWNQLMVLRAITIPVSEILDGTWKEFDEAIHNMWGVTTQCMNWMMTQFYVRDVRREEMQKKMLTMPKTYLYPEARVLFPQLPPQSVAALEQAAKAKYRSRRYDIIWRCASSLPTYRYPVPFSMPNQSWSVNVEDSRVVVDVRIAGRRWRLHLKGGARYRRQLAQVRRLVENGVKGSLDFYPRRIDGNLRTLCKMTAWLPRSVDAESLEGVLVVRSTAQSLLIAVNQKDDKLWEYHADHLRRWSAEHRARLERWADDSKFEQRPIPAFEQRRREAAGKYGRRMNSAVQEIVASLSGYARRRRFATVRYDDSDTSFCPGFPWFALRECLRIKLHEYGIAFEVASASVVKSEQDPLAEE